MLGKNWALGNLCQIVEGHQLQHLTLKCCAGAGPQKILTVTLKWANIKNNIFKVAPEAKCVP